MCLRVSELEHPPEHLHDNQVTQLFPEQIKEIYQ